MTRKLTTSDLYRAMLGSGNYDDHSGIIDALDGMTEEVADGCDPEEVLHCEGFEPDYIFDLLDYAAGLLA